MPATFEIVTPAQQRAYFHPLRLKILNFLVRERLTVSQTASRLRVHPANITHHFRILRRAGLIRLVEERDIGRVVEKYYAAVAEVFDVRPQAGSVRHVGRGVLSLLRNDLAGNMERLKADDSDALIGLLMTARIDSKRYADFARRLGALAKEFGGRDDKDGANYALTLGLYPQRLDYGPIGHYEISESARSSRRPATRVRRGRASSRS
jgi:DNA-binding transcriptional ArsR family regulator